ncbi:hypothetical protein AB833_22510 [Chromatiales bacterium (ex Bugula neritina AB1)]|nr:hypothetical protein AB833_22510 [Chromatiales bacterium (ex Bugula neritina AB1)]
MVHPASRWFTDIHFIIAIAIGPCVWLLLRGLLQNTGSGAIDLQVLLYACLLYPVLEELAFRGFIQSVLLERQWAARRVVAGVSTANLLTSIAFALAHLLNQPPLWALSVFFPSLVFGYFRDRTGSVLPSVVLHCWYNAGFYLLVR